MSKRNYIADIYAVSRIVAYTKIIGILAKIPV